jgi:hypothetical protein
MKRLKRQMTALASLGLLTGVSMLTAGPAHAIGTNYSFLQNASSGECLEMAGSPATTTWGAQTDQWGCNGGDNQTWVFQDAGGGFMEIINHSSGLCMEIPGNPPSGNNGAPVQQWPCNGGLNQKWYFTGNTYYTANGNKERQLANGNNLCAEIPGNPATTSYGAGGEQWQCNGGPNQYWITDASLLF